MPYFLGIVLEQDIFNGTIMPAYILCQAKVCSENRSGWRVVRQDEDNPVFRMKPVIVKTMQENQHMIDFLSNYRTRDHMHGDKNYKAKDTRKYYPKGALFWFECTPKGKWLRNAIFVKKVPCSHGMTDGGFANLRKYLANIPSMSVVLTKEPNMLLNEFTNKRIVVNQPYDRPGRKKKCEIGMQNSAVQT